MSHSLAYLAGVGAAALGQSASDCPIRCTDYDAYGDFLNGMHDAPPSNVDGEDVDDIFGERDDLRVDIEKASKLLADVLAADEDCDIVALAEMAAARIAAQAPATAAE